MAASSSLTTILIWRFPSAKQSYDGLCLMATDDVASDAKVKQRIVDLVYSGPQTRLSAPSPGIVVLEYCG